MTSASLTSIPSPGPAPRSLARNVAWTLAGTGVYSASQWLIIVVLAHAGSTRSVGQYAMGLATTAPIVLLAGLQLRDVQATDVRHQHMFADYLGLRLAALALASVAIVLAAALATPDREGFWTVVLLGTAKLFESLSDLHYGLLQQHERMDRIAQSSLLRGLGGLAAAATGQLVTGSAAGAAGALALCWAVVAIGFDRRSIRVLHLVNAAQARPRFSMAHLTPLVRLSAPLGIVLMLVSLQTNVPRYFVQRALGTEQLGVFAALSSLFVAGNLIVNAVGQSASPRLARAFVANDLARFRRLLGWMLAGAVALGIGGTALAMALGRPMLALLFGPAYAAREDTFVVLMGLGSFAYCGSVLGYAMTATRRFVVQLPLFLAVVAGEALAAALLVPRHGLLGAAFAWGAALLAQCVGGAAIVTAALRNRSREIAGSIAPSTPPAALEGT